MTASQLSFNAPSFLPSSSSDYRTRSSANSNSDSFDSSGAFSDELREQMAPDSGDLSVAGDQKNSGTSNSSRVDGDKTRSSEASQSASTGPNQSNSKPNPTAPGLLPFSGNPTAIRSHVSSDHSQHATDKASSAAAAKTQSKESSRSQTGSAEGQDDVVQFGLVTQEMSHGSQAVEDSASSPDSEASSNSAETKELELKGVAGSSSVASSGDLALALRISSEKGNAGSQSTQPDDGLTAVGGIPSVPSHLLKASAVPGMQQQHSETDLSQLAATAVHTEAKSAGAEKPTTPEPAAKLEPSDFEAELLKARAEPVKGAHVQISGSDNQRLDIRLLEKNGILAVSFRSADAGLTKALQEQAPELTSALAQQHFRADLWSPGSNSSSDPGQRHSGNSNSNSQNGHSSSEDNADGRGKNKDRNQPDWLQEFEANQTGIQKRIDYTWQQ